jgi:hypothetical protein
LRDNSMADGIDLDELLAPLPEAPPEAPRKAAQREKKASKEMKRLQALVEPKETPGGPDEDGGDAEERLLKVGALRAQIKAYRDNRRFGPTLKAAGFDFEAALRRKTPRELKKEVRRLDRILLSKGGGGGDLIDVGVRVGLQAFAEKAAAPLGYDLTGLAGACFDDPAWVDQLERVKLKYMPSGGSAFLDPMLALVLATGGRAAAVAARNQMRSTALAAAPEVAARLDQPMPQAMLPPMPPRPDNLMPSAAPAGDVDAALSGIPPLKLPS